MYSGCSPVKCNSGSNNCIINVLLSYKRTGYVRDLASEFSHKNFFDFSAFPSDSLRSLSFELDSSRDLFLDRLGLVPPSERTSFPIREMGFLLSETCGFPLEEELEEEVLPVNGDAE